MLDCLYRYLHHWQRILHPTIDDCLVVTNDYETVIIDDEDPPHNYNSFYPYQNAKHSLSDPGLLGPDKRLPQVGFEPTPSEDDCNLSATP